MNKLDIPDADIWHLPDFLNEADSTELYDYLIKEAEYKQNYFNAGKGSPLPRLSQWYGDDDAKTAYPGVCNCSMLPWTVQLKELSTKIIDRIKLDIPALDVKSFNCVLLSFYRDGNDYIAWHSDNDIGLGKQLVVASLSLGATRTFMLKHKQGKFHEVISLNSGSLVVMGDDIQKHYIHQVPKELTITEGRINLTFRFVY